MFDRLLNAPLKMFLLLLAIVLISPPRPNQYELLGIFSESVVVYKSTLSLIHDRGPYHIETSPLISRANQWIGFHTIGTSVMKEIKTICLNFTVEK